MKQGGLESAEEAEGLVDELGFLMERAGWSRMAGRVLGELLLSKKPFQSQAELAKALHASVPAISVALRELIQREVVERVNVRGVRRDQYRATAAGWASWVERTLPSMQSYRDYAERALEATDEEGHPSRSVLETMRDYFAFFERELPAIAERFILNFSPRKRQRPSHVKKASPSER